MTIEELKRATRIAQDDQMEVIGKYIDEIREVDTRLDDVEFMRLKEIANQVLLYWRFSMKAVSDSINSL